MVYREDLIFGDVLSYVTRDGTVECRALGLMTKQSSIGTIGMANVAICELLGPVPLAFQQIADQWESWFESHTDRVELEWGDLSRAERPLTCVNLNDAVWAYDEVDRLWFKMAGACPRCGSNGEWRALALCCRWHGIFI